LNTYRYYLLFHDIPKVNIFFHPKKILNNFFDDIITFVRRIFSYENIIIFSEVLRPRLIRGSRVRCAAHNDILYQHEYNIIYLSLKSHRWNDVYVLYVSFVHWIEAVRFIFFRLGLSERRRADVFLKCPLIDDVGRL